MVKWPTSLPTFVGGLCALMLLACAEDGLVPAEREPGEIFRIDGRITNADALPPALHDAPIHPIVVWIGDRDAAIADGAVTARAELPDRLTLLLHRSPPEHVHLRSGDGTRTWAIARLLLHADLDGSGRWNPERDPIVGGTGDLLLLYVPGESPLRLADGSEVLGMALVTPMDCSATATLALGLHDGDTPRFRVDPATPFPVLDFALDCDLAQPQDQVSSSSSFTE